MTPPRTRDSRLGRLLRMNVERILDERDTTPPEFCSTAGIDRRAYSNLFKTEHGPQLASVERLALALGVQMFELLLPPVRSLEDVLAQAKEETDG